SAWGAPAVGSRILRRRRSRADAWLPGDGPLERMGRRLDASASAGRHDRRSRLERTCRPEGRPARRHRAPPRRLRTGPSGPVARRDSGRGPGAHPATPVGRLRAGDRLGSARGRRRRRRRGGRRTNFSAFARWRPVAPPTLTELREQPPTARQATTKPRAGEAQRLVRELPVGRYEQGEVEEESNAGADDGADEEGAGGF